jgi:hypothetical protein
MSKTGSSGAWPYKILYQYLELYQNKFEAVVATIEIFLIAYGLWEAVRKAVISQGFELDMVFQSVDFVVFLLLLLTQLSRFLVSIRRTKLGYAYDRVLEKFDSDDEPEAYRSFQQQIEAAPMGYAPGLLPAWPDMVQDLADRIAVQTASLLSLRSWFFIDRQWQRRERDSLSEWFTEFPPALWVVPEADQPSPPDGPFNGGYLSVIVPMTRHSGRSIRKGQRAADLAELDAGIRGRFGDGAGKSTEVRELDLLAYLHIHVPSNKTDLTRDDSRLLSASIQHLAFLLLAVWGTNGNDFTERWNFSVLCESSNRGMNVILQKLGFAHVKREPDGSETQRHEPRSYAGFILYELKVERGHCEEPEGRHLLVMLKKLVLALA